MQHAGAFEHRFSPQLFYQGACMWVAHRDVEVDVAFRDLRQTCLDQCVCSFGMVRKQRTDAVTFCGQTQQEFQGSNFLFGPINMHKKPLTVEGFNA